MNHIQRSNLLLLASTSALCVCIGYIVISHYNSSSAKGIEKENGPSRYETKVSGRYMRAFVAFYNQSKIAETKSTIQSSDFQNFNVYFTEGKEVIDVDFWPRSGEKSTGSQWSVEIRKRDLKIVSENVMQ